MTEYLFAFISVITYLRIDTPNIILGAHLNPAVTVAYCLTGRSKWKQLPFHWMGQYLGAFLAAVMVFGTYSDAIYNFDPWYTVPGAEYSKEDISKDMPTSIKYYIESTLQEVPQIPTEDTPDETLYTSLTPTADIFATYPHSTGEKVSYYDENEPDVEPYLYEKISIGICM